MDDAAAGHLQNTYDQAVVERHLERMVGRMIDINYHLITGAGEAPPADYHASFLRLGEMQVLDVEFARRIAGSAGPRNRLVHEYDEIDPTRVFEGLQVLQHRKPVEDHVDMARQRVVQASVQEKALTVGRGPVLLRAAAVGAAHRRFASHSR